MKLRASLNFTASLTALGAFASGALAQGTVETVQASAAVQPAAEVGGAAPADAAAPAADDAASPPVAGEAPAASSEAGETIVVTGSRLRSSTFTSPTPVTAVTQQELLAAAPGNLAEGLRQIPSVVPGGGQTAGGGTRAGGQNFLNLRGLGNNRSLVLLDGRRFAPSGPDLLIDVNLMPQGLVQRVDVVTGGASATYGSDAVAGVVNFILDKRFTGFKLDTSYGISQRGDNREFKITGTGGLSLIDDRLHLVASAEYYDNAGISGSERAFRRMAGNQITNPTGTPRLVRANDIRTPFTTGGLVVVGAGGLPANNNQIFGIQFGPGGAPLPYDYGTLSTTLRSAGGTQNGGDGFRVSTGQEIVRPLTRKTGFAHADFELSDSITLFAEGLYGKTQSSFENSPTTRTFTIQRANPFLALAAPDLVARMTLLNIPSFSMNRLILERGPTITGNDNETIRALGGAEGKIGDWSWDIAYQYGRNKNHSPTFNNLNVANFARAVNTVRAVAGNPGGVAAGTIVCADVVSANPATRATAAGCVPFNPFGAGSPSDPALDYVFGTSVFDTTTEQQVADVNISGTLFNLPAGEVGIAAGAEWRRIKATTVADPLSIAGAYRLVNQQNFRGKDTVKEVYGELQVPILKDSALAESLDLNLAGRHTDYATSGGVQTWKVGLVWQIVDDFRLRGTYSRDIRAPHLEELFATGRQNNITIVDELTRQTFLAVPNLTFGNEALKPEKAKTKVIGFVYQPSWLSGFSLAVDYYDIKIAGAILNVGGQNAVTQCNISNQASAICAFVTRDPASNAVIGTRTSPLNLTAQKTSGVDIESVYRVPMDSFFDGNPGRLSLRAVASYTAKNKVLNPLIANPVDDAGNLRPQSIGIAPQPHWRATASLNYETDQIELFLQGRYIDSMTWDKTLTLGVDTDFNHISPQFYLDGQIAFKVPYLGHDQEIFLNVQNILDHEPPYAPNPTGATPLPTDPNLYDQVGRMFRIGLRARF